MTYTKQDASQVSAELCISSGGELEGGKHCPLECALRNVLHLAVNACPGDDTPVGLLGNKETAKEDFKETIAALYKNIREAHRLMHRPATKEEIKTYNDQGGTCFTDAKQWGVCHHTVPEHQKE